MTSIFEYDQRVTTRRGTGVVAFIDYRQTCPTCRGLDCRKYDVQLDAGVTETTWGCQMAEALAEGETLAASAGAAIVAVQCIRPGYAYRLSIRRASSGAEVEELSRSFPSEHVARRAASTATLLFRGGITVQQALDLLTVFQPAAA